MTRQRPVEGALPGAPGTDAPPTDRSARAVARPDGSGPSVSSPPDLAPPAPPGFATELTGTARLIRLALRRDRVLLPVWLAVLVGLLAASVASIVGLYATEAERVQYAVVASTNLVARAFDGPMAGTSTGAIVMTETFGFLALLAGVMSVQAVVRHTRLDEETGRAELVGSAVVGRHAPLVAALVVVAGANVVLAAATAVTLRVADLPLDGALLAGAALAGVGITFAAVAAITAQVSATARGANGLGITAIGVAFLLRAVGDAFGTVADSGMKVVSAWPSWLSPIGWGQQVRAFSDNRVWVLGLFAALTLVLVAVAFVLTGHRDVGAGMRPIPPGPARASRRLTSPTGLATRLQRSAWLGWAAGLAVFAAAFGAIADEVEALLETSDELVEVIAAMGVSDVLLDLYTVFMLALLALATAAYLVQATLRVRAEESAGRAEPVLATAVGRSRYLGAHAGWAIVGAGAILLLVGVVAATTAGLATGLWGDRFLDWVLAATVHLPALLVLGGFTVAAIGWLPRFAVPIAWAALVVSLVVGQFGALFELPQAAMNVSPFTHVPPVPAEDLRLLPLALLLAVAAGLYALGFAGWRRRDLDV